MWKSGAVDLPRQRIDQRALVESIILAHEISIDLSDFQEIPSKNSSPTRSVHNCDATNRTLATVYSGCVMFRVQLSFIGTTLVAPILHRVPLRNSTFLASIHNISDSARRNSLPAFPLINRCTMTSGSNQANGGTNDTAKNPGIDSIVNSTRFQSVFAEAKDEATIPVDLIPSSEWEKYVSSQDDATQTWLSTFPSPPRVAIPVPSAKQSVTHFAVPVKKDANPIARIASALTLLPSARTYVIRESSGLSETLIEFVWGLLTYSFTLYKKNDKPTSTLVRLTDASSTERQDVDRAITATYMVRDMITTTAEDFGPPQLEAAVTTLAAMHAATASSIVADQLLSLGYPQVHRVGRAAAPDRGPRLLELNWGDTSAPLVTLVGKGVCYDTGGLSLKPTSSMLTMKKDMGGAAQVIGLAHMIMDAKLPVQLRVLIPAVENSVAGNSYRPGDVLTARNGFTTLNVNSDAEGRLILADALVAATEENPDIIIDCATLTGAQRVAMGPDIPTFFCTDDGVAASLFAKSKEANDLMWQMPLYEPYRKMLDTPLADIKSCGSGSQGGCIAAALYLKEFVGNCLWIHVDMMGYNATSSPGRPEGGEAMGMRALFEMLRERYS